MQPRLEEAWRSLHLADRDIRAFEILRADPSAYVSIVCHPDAVFRLPIYLEPDIDERVTRLAEEKQIDVQDLVNELLRSDLELTKRAT